MTVVVAVLVSLFVSFTLDPMLSAVWRDHAMVSDRDRALAAGCDEYDTKPVEFHRLLGKIQGLLSVGSRI